MSDTPPFTDPADVKAGANAITVKSVQYGAQTMLLDKDVTIPTRDGGTLFANVFRPTTQGKYPVVISADIYGKDSIHMVYAGMMPGAASLGMYTASQFAAWEAPDPAFWVPNGYAVVKVALRGTSGSKGTISPMSDEEALDYCDAIEWAGVQPWSTGAVGMNGVSYLAMTQWRAAQFNPPHLKAMIPWEGVSDMYREWSFHGGIPETGFTRRWIKGVAARNPGATVEDFTALERDHPLLDSFWQSRHGNLANIKVPMYVGASWSTQGLHNRGTIEGFRQASSQHKWIEIHGRKEWESYYKRDALERQKAFFDHFLKGIENDWQDTPRVRLEVRDRFYQGQERFENEWPIARTQYVSLYLDAAKHALVPSKPTSESALSYDSTVPGGPSGSAIFTIRFAESIELSGYMKLKLFVSTSAGDDMDLFVGVHKRDKRGVETHFADFNHIENGIVSHGWLRVSHRERDEARSTPYQPWLTHAREQKLRPGEIVSVEIEILPSSTLFRAGESLQITVQGTDIGRMQTNPLPALHGVSRYEHSELRNNGRHTIHTGAQYDSHLLIPVIPAKP